MDYRHEWHTVNGVRLHCVVAGEGPLVLLLHGFPEFWYSWRYQIPVLARHFTVVAPDLRGYNDSDKPPRIADYTLPVLIEDVRQLIHCFGQEQAIVAGHDWGGSIAWATALTHPGLIRKLAVLNAPHPRLFMQHLLTNPRQMIRSWYALLFQLPWLPEAVFQTQGYYLMERVIRGLAMHKHQSPDEVIAQYKRAISKPGVVTSGLNYYRATDPRYFFKLNPIARMPVLVVWGEKDPAIVKELNDDLPRYTPDLRLHIIPNASHWVQQECPDLVNHYLLDFLLNQ